MNYYIAKDRFGNYDLAHYGVKGMKWGETNIPDIFNSATRRSAAPNNQKKSSSYLLGKSGQTASSSTASKVPATSASSPSPKTSVGQTPQVNKAVVEQAVKSESPTPKDDNEVKIQAANVAYQTALMQMQLLARTSLANGISPSSNPEYLAARKETIKAKYELDKLKLQQQEDLAKNPPTMAEQRKIADSNAKKELAEDKQKDRSYDPSKYTKGLGSRGGKRK